MEVMAIETSIWYHYQQSTSYSYPNHGRYIGVIITTTLRQTHGTALDFSHLVIVGHSSAGKGSRVFVELLGV